MAAESDTPSSAILDATADRAPDPLIVVVVDLLETEGYDAVQLREVARRARMSLSTIYKRYTTREDLIAAALQWWMDANRYAPLAGDGTERGDESVPDGLLRIFRTIFEPWEQHPGMLKAYVRAQAGPNGNQLTRHGFDTVVPAVNAVLNSTDPGFAEDLGMILSGVILGSLSRFAAGEIAVTDILPSIERTLYWLFNGYEHVTGGSAGTHH